MRDALDQVLMFGRTFHTAAAISMLLVYALAWRSLNRLPIDAGRVRFALLWLLCALAICAALWQSAVAAKAWLAPWLYYLDLVRSK